MTARSENFDEIPHCEAKSEKCHCEAKSEECHL